MNFVPVDDSASISDRGFEAEPKDLQTEGSSAELARATDTQYGPISEDNPQTIPSTGQFSTYTRSASATTASGDGLSVPQSSQAGTINSIGRFSAEDREVILRVLHRSTATQAYLEDLLRGYDSDNQANAPSVISDSMRSALINIAIRSTEDSENCARMVIEAQQHRETLIAQKKRLEEYIWHSRFSRGSSDQILALADIGTAHLKGTSLEFPDGEQLLSYYEELIKDDLERLEDQSAIYWATTIGGWPAKFLKLYKAHGHPGPRVHQGRSRHTWDDRNSSHDP